VVSGIHETKRSRALRCNTGGLGNLRSCRLLAGLQRDAFDVGDARSTKEEGVDSGRKVGIASGHGPNVRF
jgi:hypothetical protein